MFLVVLFIRPFGADIKLIAPFFLKTELFRTLLP